MYGYFAAFLSVFCGYLVSIPNPLFACEVFAIPFY